MPESQSPAKPKSTPNVVLVVTDDQGYGDFGCTGNPWLKTPELDRLHDDAVRLRRFHVDPMCAPSRAALMTGCYSARVGVWSTLTGRYFLNLERRTMADAFRDAGYRTGMFGKWHLGDSKRYLPHRRGFDEALYHCGGVIGEMPDRWNNDYFNAVFQRNGSPQRFADTYCTDVWFDEAQGFIERSVGEQQPFFCYLATNAPHSPYDVHERYAKPYREQGVPDARARFFGMIANLDENVGRLRSTLDRLGIAEDTVLIYMGDNGTACGATVDGEGHVLEGYNAGMRGKKCWATDGGHRNLCLIRWPRGGWRGGRDVEPITAHFDLLPTLANACGLVLDETDGTDLGPTLSGHHDASLDDRSIVVHNQQRDNPEKYKDFEVLTRDWRLIQTTEWGPGRRELTAVAEDPGQRIEVSQEHPDVVQDLMKTYEAWWQDLDATFDQTWPFFIGRDEPEVTMTAHAWHGTTQPTGIYDQSHCRLGVVQNGYWLVEVLDPGRYRFELRRWPREADAGITAGVPARTGIPHVTDRPAGVALPIREAGLTLVDDADGTTLNDQSTEVNSSMRHATFDADLRAGRHRVFTRFIGVDGTEWGAYYLYLARVEDRAASFSN
ncbi:MAG: arylsulfatase [Planctomycetota bacterium]